MRLFSLDLNSAETSSVSLSLSSSDILSDGEVKH